jgi:hypothetical protein
VPRTRIETAARRLAGALREAITYPPPDHAVSIEMMRIIRDLEREGGLAAAASAVSGLVEHLACHLQELLKAPDDPYAIHLRSYPDLSGLIPRLLQACDRYLEEREKVPIS